MEAYPLRMRRRIIELYEQGKSTHEIAEVLGTCRSGTRRVRQRLRERGTLEPAATKRPGRTCGMTEARERRLRELVAADPDATREQLRDRLGVAADVRTIGRWLKRLGFVLKKSRCMPPSSNARTSPNDARPGTDGSRTSTRAASSSSTSPAPARA